LLHLFIILHISVAQKSVERTLFRLDIQQVLDALREEYDSQTTRFATSNQPQPVVDRSCKENEVCTECPQLIEAFQDGRINLTYAKSKYCGDILELTKQFCCPKQNSATTTTSTLTKNICDEGEVCITCPAIMDQFSNGTISLEQLGSKLCEEILVDQKYQKKFCCPSTLSTTTTSEKPGYVKQCKDMNDKELEENQRCKCEARNLSDADKKICRDKFNYPTTTQQPITTTTTTTTTTTYDDYEEEEEPLTSFEDALDVIRGYRHSYYLKDFVRRNNPNEVDQDGDTVLIWAVILDNSQAVNIIFNNSNVIDVNHQNKFGWSALHQAVSKGYVEIVNILLQQTNIDVNLKITDTGETALDLANKNKKSDIADILEQNDGRCNTTAC